MKILILCQWAASSMAILKKMRSYVNDFPEFEIEIECDAVTSVPSIDFKKYDLILLAPQTRHYRKEVERRTQGQEILIDSIDISAYGLGDGEKILKQAVNLYIGRNKNNKK